VGGGASCGWDGSFADEATALAGPPHGSCYCNAANDLPHMHTHTTTTLPSLPLRHVV
jgi:hypothetical protein